MFQRFYNNTIYSNYIKYILLNTYIPTVPFTCNINHITKGCTYIHDKHFVRAKKSEDMVQVNRDKSNFSTYFTRYEPYIFGKLYVGLTTNYISNTDVYDPETHFYLGQYLKAYKAYYDIDLFPYYNCFSDEYLSNIILEKRNDNSMPYVTYRETSSQNNYKILSIPISLCQEYTIAIDCSEEVLMCPVFVGKKGILKEQTNILHAALAVAPHPQVHEKSNYIHTTTSFKNPVYFFSPCIPGVYDKAQLTLPQYEKYLRLLIRLPINNKSSITVLQGHYKNVKELQDKIINLSISDVKDLLSEIKETDYLAGSSTTLETDESLDLTYYGSAENVIYENPSILYHTTDLSLNQRIIQLKSELVEVLNLESTVKMTPSDSIRLIYPLDRPRITAVSSTEVTTYTDHPFGTDGKIKYRKNGSIISDTIPSLTNRDYLEIKFIGGIHNNNHYYDSEWSVPYVYNDSNVVKKPDLTITNSGEIHLNLYGDQVYEYYIGDEIKELTLWKRLTLNNLVGGSNAILLKDKEKINIRTSSVYDGYEPILVSDVYIKPKAKVNLTLFLNKQIIQINGSGIKLTVDDKLVTTDQEYLQNDNLIYIPPTEENTWSKSFYISAISSIYAEVDYGATFTIYSNNLKLESNTDNTLIDKYSITLSGTTFTCNSDSDYVKNYKKTDNSISITLFNPLDTDSSFDFNYVNWINLEVLNVPNINKYLNNYLYNNLSLLYINDTNSYPFNSRLMEYLVNNVITKNDKFVKNIEKTQKYLDITVPSSRYSEQILIDGNWTNELRIKAFEIANKLQDDLGYPNFTDINGFIDKDTEKAIKDHYYKYYEK